MTHVVAVVPAHNQIQSISATVKALLGLEELGEVVVVDDGSTDGTGEAAREAGARVISLPKNLGKGGAVSKAVGASGAPDGYLLIDADLSSSASHAKVLLEMLTSDAADMIVSVFPKAGRSRGYGIVKRMANRILLSATGRSFEEPLSGQRAIKGPLLRALNLASGFGLEVGMTLDVAAKNARILEAEVPFIHRASGRNIAGFIHRGIQGADLLKAAASRLGWRSTLAAVVKIPFTEEWK